MEASHFIMFLGSNTHSHCSEDVQEVIINRRTIHGSSILFVLCAVHSSASQFNCKNSNGIDQELVECR